ncbi:MAG: porin [bacterium]
MLALAAAPAPAVRVSARSGTERLDIDGYAHVQWRQILQGGGSPRYGFVLRRARVEFDYRFDERVAASLELGGDRLALSVKDAFIEYRVGRPLRLVAGLRKMPFSREELRPSNRLLTIERGETNDEFGELGFLGRDIGLAVDGELFEPVLPVGYALGVYNGTRFYRDDNDAKQFVERLTVAPARWLAVGLNATQRNDTLTGRLVGAGGGDVLVSLGAATVEAEALAGTAEPGRTLAGGHVTGAYRLGAFEPVARFERFSPDVAAGDWQTTATAGLNWHVHRGARLKANLVAEFEPGSRAGYAAVVEAQAGF